MTEIFHMKVFYFLYSMSICYITKIAWLYLFDSFKNFCCSILSTLSLEYLTIVDIYYCLQNLLKMLFSFLFFFGGGDRDLLLSIKETGKKEFLPHFTCSLSIGCMLYTPITYNKEYRKYYSLPDIEPSEKCVMT